MKAVIAPLLRHGGPATLKHRLCPGGIGDVLPDVFRHVAKHGGNGRGQTFDDQGHHGLAAAATLVSGGAHVQPVFGNVEIKIR